jgi:hypothetical protein
LVPWKADGWISVILVEESDARVDRAEQLEKADCVEWGLGSTWRNSKLPWGFRGGGGGLLYLANLSSIRREGEVDDGGQGRGIASPVVELVVGAVVDH